LKAEGQYVATQEQIIGNADSTENLVIPVQFLIPPTHQSVVVVTPPLARAIDRYMKAEPLPVNANALTIDEL
jgi:hypothetical protein